MSHSFSTDDQFGKHLILSEMANGVPRLRRYAHVVTILAVCRLAESALFIWRGKESRRSSERSMDDAKQLCISEILCCWE